MNPDELYTMIETMDKYLSDVSTFHIMNALCQCKLYLQELKVIPPAIGMITTEIQKSIIGQFDEVILRLKTIEGFSEMLEKLLQDETRYAELVRGWEAEERKQSPT